MTSNMKKTVEILTCIFVVTFIVLWAALSYKSLPAKPIESTITKRDDCTVIKTMLTDTDYIFVSVCKIIEM